MYVNIEDTTQTRTYSFNANTKTFHTNTNSISFWEILHLYYTRSAYATCILKAEVSRKKTLNKTYIYVVKGLRRSHNRHRNFIATKIHINMG